MIGALALAGIPILNGFWSKELILEAGLKPRAALWAYIVMLFGVGLTALYTLRMVYLVFFGEPRSQLHAHDAQTAMKVSLGLLAFGALTTWLLAGPLYQLLTSTLPFHQFHELTTLDMVSEVITAPATYLALFVVAIGGLCWWKRDALSGHHQAAARFRAHGDEQLRVRGDQSRRRARDAEHGRSAARDADRPAELERGRHRRRLDRGVDCTGMGQVT